MRGRLFDCFCYYDEDEVLEVRLHVLSAVVDFFVIVEAPWNFKGERKRLNFNLERFGKFSAKIRYIVAEENPGNAKSFWENENHQRNQIHRGLFDLNDADFIMISDLDEIPNPDEIFKYKPSFMRGDFKQKYYAYYFNNLLRFPCSEAVWCGTKITTGKHFRDFFCLKATDVRSFKSSGPLRLLKRIFFRYFFVQVIEQGGWHFTWIGSASNILRKARLVHAAHNVPLAHDPDPQAEIAVVIRSGRDILIRNRRYERVDLRVHFPAKVVQAISKYPLYIL